MRLQDKYELEWVVCNGPVRTYWATEIASSRPVFVHLFVSAPEASSLGASFERVRSVKSNWDAAETQPVREIVDFAETPYVVTEVLEPFTTFEEWLEAEAKGSQRGSEGYWKDLVDQRLETGGYDDALKLLQDALGEFPDNADLKRTEHLTRSLLRVEELYREGRDQAALKVLWRARKLDKRNAVLRKVVVDSLFERARNLTAMGRPAADRLARQVQELEATTSAAHDTDEVHDTEEAIENQNEKFALWSWATARRLMDEGNVDGARAVAGHGLAAYRNETPFAPEEVTAEKLEAEQAAAATKAASWWERLRVKEFSLPKWNMEEWWGPATVGLATATVLIAVGVGAVLWMNTLADPRGPLATYPVRIQSSPPGAQISIGDKECGVSSCEVDLPEGRYQATARLAGYESVTGEIEVGAHQISPGPVALTLTPLAPTIRLYSDLARGQVALDGQPIGELENGIFEMQLDNLEAGAHTLTVSNWESEATIRFEANPGSPPVIQGSVETRNLSAAVLTGLGASTQVQGDGELLSQAEGEEGAYQVALGTGGNRQEVRFEAAPNPTLAAFLKSDPNIGGLQIHTDEDGANVYLNGKKYHGTTEDGRLVAFVRPGQYRVWIEKKGFRKPAEKVVSIRKGERKHLSFTLAQQMQTATLRIRDGLPGTEVLVDGSLRGRIGPEGEFSLSEVELGSHEVLLRKAPYKARRFERRFLAGHAVELDGTLQQAVGTLKIEVAPPGLAAQLRLRREGETIERAISDPTLTLARGTYTLTGTAPGYEKSAASVHVSADQTKTVRLALRPRLKERLVPAVRLRDWERRGGWSRDGGLLVRRGGDFVMSPVESGSGTYDFTVILKRGRRLEWIVNYVDDDNYALYQLGKNYLHRIQVVDGYRSEPLKVGHPLDHDDFIRLKIEVSPDAVVHKVLQKGEWAVLDRWVHTGAGFADGSFGFYVPSRNQIGLQDFRFVPKS